MFSPPRCPPCRFESHCADTTRACVHRLVQKQVMWGFELGNEVSAQRDAFPFSHFSLLIAYVLCNKMLSFLCKLVPYVLCRLCLLCLHGADHFPFSAFRCAFHGADCFVVSAGRVADERAMHCGRRSTTGTSAGSSLCAATNSLSGADRRTGAAKRKAGRDSAAFVVCFRGANRYLSVWPPPFCVPS